ncbi:tRNA pseudouridine(65) synthase TruC [Endozoicomonas sp. G2_1]|uniref:tRNA pseudouridine(65) synthase TruC n=1 Tax=Endozoicomonas sp. G2_1 TaxID=2821091 RepID=UPI001ADD0A29|nr:tRNA pseudouridine(65) synthase TruC [Endozoicomonas sp. G2_1]MBO9491933.1 tRNA pseudouridine(65) synthase TruC [Endozoicomonas sp. G2_1]
MTSLVNDTAGKPSTECEFDDKPVLKILYEDEYLVAVDKPSGLFVHRSYLDRHEKYFALQLVRDQVGQYVYPVHRLDRPTSGVLLFALTEEVARAMNTLFSERKITKTYYALCRGFLNGAGEINHPLKEKLDKIGDKFANQQQEEKAALSSYQTLAQASLPIAVGKYPSVRYSLVKVEPKTGRRHQIRRHLAHLRHPIIGDINYGDNKQNPFFAEHFGLQRLMLHAQKLNFEHPVTKQNVTIEASFDSNWLAVFERLNWSEEELLNKALET